MATAKILTSVATRDVNGDGYPGIVTNEPGGFVAEHLSNGDGTFSPYIRLAGFDGLNGPFSLGDVNGDGKLDVVFVADPVAVFLGNGDGTFGPLITQANFFFSGTAITLADLNGDGKLDLAVVRVAYTSAVVLEGKGDGTFVDVGSTPRVLTQMRLPRRT